MNPDGIDWIEAKAFVEAASGISHDALHVILGVAVQLLAAALLRSSLAGVGPWLVVLALELVNEWNDLAVEQWPSPGQQWGESAKDLALTMVLPTLLLLIARWRPGLFRRQ